MKKQLLKSKWWIVALLCLMFLVPASLLLAWGRYHWHGGGWHRWYGPGWFGVYVGVPHIAIGAVVDALPYGYSTVIIGGMPYYCYDSIYYRAIPEGYVVVPAPVVSPSQPATVPTVSYSAPVFSQTPEKAGNTITINIPNSKGGFNPVTLKKYKNGYMGPQGEYYEGNPSVEQLKALYGK
jgi:hypothetical protein